MDWLSDFQPEKMPLKIQANKILRYIRSITQEDYYKMREYLNRFDPPPKGTKINIYQDIQMICAFKNKEKQLQQCNKQQERAGMQRQIIEQLAAALSLKPITVRDRITVKLPGVPFHIIMSSMEKGRNLIFAGKQLAATEVDEERLLKQEYFQESSEQEVDRPFKRRQQEKPALSKESLENNEKSIYRYGKSAVVNPILLKYKPTDHKIYCYQQNESESSEESPVHQIECEPKVEKELQALQQWVSSIENSQKDIRWNHQQHKQQTKQLLETVLKLEDICGASSGEANEAIWRKIADTVRTIKDVLINLLRLSTDTKKMGQKPVEKDSPEVECFTISDS